MQDKPQQQKIPGTENIYNPLEDFPETYEQANKFLRKNSKTTIILGEDHTLVKVALAVDDEEAETGKYGRSYEVPALADTSVESEVFKGTVLAAAQRAHKFKQLRQADEL